MRSEPPACIGEAIRRQSLRVTSAWMDRDAATQEQRIAFLMRDPAQLDRPIPIGAAPPWWHYAISSTNRVNVGSWQCAPKA
jgi:hypothetical protein